jgi:hypothetical protein
MVQTRYGSLTILGHSLRNKIPIVRNFTVPPETYTAIMYSPMLENLSLLYEVG